MRIIISYKLRINDNTVIKLSPVDYAKLDAHSQAGDFKLSKIIDDFLVEFDNTRSITVTVEVKPAEEF